jgi:hypothetical protein
MNRITVSTVPVGTGCARKQTRRGARADETGCPATPVFLALFLRKLHCGFELRRFSPEVARNEVEVRNDLR